jgi:hypothetical protein
MISLRGQVLKKNKIMPRRENVLFKELAPKRMRA